MGGYSIVNIYSTYRCYVGDKITMWSGALVPAFVPSRVLDKITLLFQRYVILDAHRQQTISKVKIDLCQGSYRPMM